MVNIQYRKARINDRGFPLAGYHYPLSPWALHSVPFRIEQEWLQRAWSILAEQGLTKYETESERALVAIRVMALALMYLDFCSKVFEVPTDEPPVEVWAKSLGLADEVLLGFLIGTRGNEFCLEDLEDEDKDKLWKVVANNTREDVFDALLRGFGSVGAFFESIAAISKADHDTALEAFDWFSEKMPPLDQW